MSEIAAKVKAIIVDKLGLTKVKLHLKQVSPMILVQTLSTLLNLLWNSKKNSTYHIPDEQAEKIGTVGEAIAYIENVLK